MDRNPFGRRHPDPKVVGIPIPGDPAEHNSGRPKIDQNHEDYPSNPSIAMHPREPREARGRQYVSAQTMQAGQSLAPNDEERRLSDMAKLRELCMGRVDSSQAAGKNRDQLILMLIGLVGTIASEMSLPMSREEERQVSLDLADDMTGIGPLQNLLNDQSINDIMVNGPNNVFIERYGMVSKIDNIRFRDNAHLTNICQRIASAIGRRVDESSPMVDARLKDGSRVNVILPPIAIDGASLSIRKFRARPIGLGDMVSYGSMTTSVAKLLEIISYCRLNVIISGGTGSGKTTLLNAISKYIDETDRVITVEDAAELQLQQPHVVRLETRPPNIEGKGEISQRDLVRNALRMRPDRIIIGEVRGAEAFDMLQAMNTGHDGSMSTVHANNARDAIARIENMVSMSNSGLAPEAVRSQIVSAVNIIVQIQRQRDGSRRLIQLVEISGMEKGVPLLNEIAKFEVEGETADGKIRGYYRIMPVRSSFYERLSYFKLADEWSRILQEAQKEKRRA